MKANTLLSGSKTINLENDVPLLHIGGGGPAHGTCLLASFQSSIPVNLPHPTWSSLICGYKQENEQHTAVLASLKALNRCALRETSDKSSGHRPPRLGFPRPRPHYSMLFSAHHNVQSRPFPGWILSRGSERGWGAASEGKGWGLAKSS